MIFTNKETTLAWLLQLKSNQQSQDFFFFYWFNSDSGPYLQSH